MDLLQMLNIVQTQYPDALPILSKPGVAAVYVQYLNANPPWTSAQLQAALRATEYYQSTDQTARNWDILQATDPATAGQQAADTKRMFEDLQRQLGVTLSTAGGFSSQSFQLFTRAVREGWDENRMRYEILAAAGKSASGGEVASTAAQIRQLANDYGIVLSDQAIMDYATKMAQGAETAESVKGYILTQAKSLYPWMADQIDRGFTVRQIADPYLQLAQQELGIDPSTVNLTDPKWSKLLSSVDPKTGQKTMMPLDSALAMIRTDPSFGYDTTSQGRQSATMLATQLQKSFGAMG